MLIERNSGKRVDVVYREIKQSDLKRFSVTRRNGWKFDWNKPYKEGYTVYGLFVKGKPTIIQGLIALQPQPFPVIAVYIQNLEAAPQNKTENRSRHYIGVGKHLLAIACKISFEHELEGAVYLKSKTDTMSFYQDEGAIPIGEGRLFINSDSAMNILAKYNL